MRRLTPGSSPDTEVCRQGNHGTHRTVFSVQDHRACHCKRAHASVCTPEMTAFICREFQHRVRDGFNILLPEADAVRLFREKLKVSRIAAVPQEHRRPRLILNLSAQPNKGTPIVNETTVREIAP